jgi:hypothetical protein
LLFAYALRARESGWQLPMLHGIRLAGTIFRHCMVADSRWRDSGFYRTQFHFRTPPAAVPALIGDRHRHASPVLTLPLPARPSAPRWPYWTLTGIR